MKKPSFAQQFLIAQLAELVDALVSNTRGCKPVPVRLRHWVQASQAIERLYLFKRVDSFSKHHMHQHKNSIGLIQAEWFLRL